MSKITFKGSRYQLAGELPALGGKAPDFSLVTTELRDVSIDHWLNKRKILNVFLSVDLEVCAKSVIAFDRYAAAHDDLAMLMISVDLPFAHARFRKEHDLQQVTQLSAIRHAGFGENYGVQITEGPLKGFFARAVIVVDENNSVVYTELVEDVTEEPDYAAAFRSLAIDIEE
ncbi:MAG TPA: thiol peroxidase [Woeseiaceae bacterium]